VYRQRVEELVAARREGVVRGCVGVCKASDLRWPKAYADDHGS
jgi:hypothetical protein